RTSATRSNPCRPWPPTAKACSPPTGQSPASSFRAPVPSLPRSAHPGRMPSNRRPAGISRPGSASSSERRSGGASSEPLFGRPPLGGQRMSKLADIFRDDGEVYDHAPRWAKYRADVQKSFPSPFRGDGDPLSLNILSAIQHLNGLRPEKGGPAWLGSNPALTIDFDAVRNARLAPNMASVADVIGQAVQPFQG